MKRASYKAAITWIAENDDTEFMDYSDPSEYISVSALLVADLFDVSVDKVVKDLAAELSKIHQKHLNEQF